MKLTNNTSKKIFGGLFAALLGLLSIGTAHAQTVLNFSTLPGGTPITTQYAAQGLTVATQDADGNFGVAETGSSPYIGGISNSTTGEYPTTEYLNLTFALPTTVQSFTFNNYGSFGGGSDPRGDSFYNAYSSTDVLLGSGSLSSIQGSSITLNLANVSLLQFSNGTTTESDSWEFVVGSVTYSEAAVPEPSSYALALIGLGWIAYLRFRARRARV